MGRKSRGAEIKMRADEWRGINEVYVGVVGQLIAATLCPFISNIWSACSSPFPAARSVVVAIIRHRVPCKAIVAAWQLLPFFSTAAAIRMPPHPEAYGLAFLILSPKYQSITGVGIPMTTPASANTVFPHP